MNFPSSFTVISDEVSQDLPEIARFIHRFGLGGFELRSIFGRAFKDLTISDRASIAQTIRNEGWKIYGCASPVFKCELTDLAAIQEHLDIFKRSLEVAHALECNLVRVFTFLRRPGSLDATTLDQITEHLLQLGELAAGSGVQIGIENENSCLVGSGEEALALALRLPAPAFGLIWDPCNVLYVPQSAPPAAAAFAQLCPRVVHIHVKDAVRRPAGRTPAGPASVPVGIGDVGWREYFAAILRSGYQGMLSLETHWRRERLDEKLLHLPAGYAFSRAGDEASSTCFANIQAIWPLLS
jgi:sugar phosphate isomerase/epimerase